jgi:hypothetical protein
MSSATEAATGLRRAGLPARRVFFAAAWAYVGYNVVASAVGAAVGLPDLPASHAATVHLTVEQALLSQGTIMSPPLVTMVIAALLLWAAASARRAWMCRACTAVLVVGITLTALDTSGGMGDKPALYSAGRWDLALAIGWVFVVVAACAAVSGVVWLVQSLAGPRPSAAKCR